MQFFIHFSMYIGPVLKYTEYSHDIKSRHVVKQIQASNLQLDFFNGKNICLKVIINTVSLANRLLKYVFTFGFY